MPENQYPTSTIQDPSQLTKDKQELSKDIRNGSSLLRKQFRAAGIYDIKDMRYHDTFYRFRRIDPYFMVEGGFEYLFFTKPDLSLIDEGENLTVTATNDTDIYGRGSNKMKGGANYVPYLRRLWEDGYKRTFADLCASYHGVYGDSCPFVRILSNRKTSNMDIPDIVTNELETAQNMYGTRIFYPTSSMKSDEDVEFSIEFEDTQYLEIYHFFKAYDVYRQMKWLGLMSPKQHYIDNKILHDHMSIYKFIVDTDGETLLHWSKATGVYPKSISRSSFSELQDKGGLKITVTFKLSGWFEDMEPAILVDFNQLAGMYGYGGKGDHEHQALWDPEIQAITGEPVNYFYIDSYMDSMPNMGSPIRRYTLKAN